MLHERRPNAVWQYVKASLSLFQSTANPSGEVAMLTLHFLGIAQRRALMLECDTQRRRFDGLGG